MINTVAQNTGPSGEQPQKPRPTSGFPANREATVAQQVGTVIAVINTFTMALTMTRKSDEIDHALSDRTKVIVEGGLHAAISRMAAIMNDEARWSNSNYDDLAGKLRALYEKQNRLFDTQIALMQLQGSPHVLLSPQIVRLPNKGWAAYVGNTHLPDGILFGTGLTLKQALEDFDRVFNALPTAEQQFTYEQNKNWSVVPGGSNGVQQPPEAERQAGDNSKSAAPEPKSDKQPNVGNPKSRKRSRRN